MTDITAELVRMTAEKGLKPIPVILFWTTEVKICSLKDEVSYDVTITVRDPWTYEPLDSNMRNYLHFPTGTDYAYMIAKTLKTVHPEFYFTYGYDYIDNRITIKYEECEVEKKPLQELLKEKREENKTMRFTKVVVNGPATIAWVTAGRNPAKKVIIKKADGDAYDLEKAMLMCWVKSWFSDDTDFHKWFRTNMKMFNEAYNEAHPDIGELPVVDAAAISKNINASLERMSKALRNYKDRLNSMYGKAAVDGDDVVEEFKERFNVTEVQEPGAPWTWDEVSFLNRHYHTKSVKHIAMVLGRSEAAVRAKARKLGIKRGGDANDI